MTIKSTVRIAAIVAIILLIPLALTIRDGAVEGVGWNWTASDFAIMGSLLFLTGLAIDLALRKLPQPMHKALAVGAIVLAFLALWAQLAVGAVSQLIALLIG